MVAKAKKVLNRRMEWLSRVHQLPLAYQSNKQSRELYTVEVHLLAYQQTLYNALKRRPETSELDHPLPQDSPALSSRRRVQL
jgi:hypothetical protein